MQILVAAITCKDQVKPWGTSTEKQTLSMHTGLVPERKHMTSALTTSFCRTTGSYSSTVLGAKKESPHSVGVGNFSGSWPVQKLWYMDNRRVVPKDQWTVASFAL